MNTGWEKFISFILRNPVCFGLDDLLVSLVFFISRSKSSQIQLWRGAPRSSQGWIRYLR